MGAIKRLDKYPHGVLSTLYIIFKIINNNTTCSDYILNYYDSNRWHKEIKGIAAEGARNHGLLNITHNDFFNTTITLPYKIEEQKKISILLTSINNLITLHQCKPFSLKT